MSLESYSKNCFQGFLEKSRFAFAKAFHSSSSLSQDILSASTTVVDCRAVWEEKQYCRPLALLGYLRRYCCSAVYAVCFGCTRIAQSQLFPTFTRCQPVVKDDLEETRRGWWRSSMHLPGSGRKPRPLSTTKYASELAKSRNSNLILKCSSNSRKNSFQSYTILGFKRMCILHTKFLITGLLCTKDDYYDQVDFNRSFVNPKSFFNGIYSHEWGTWDER